MLPYHHAGHLGEANSINFWVVNHTHVPLVECLVVLYLGVLLANVRDQAGLLIVSDHVVGIKVRPEKNNRL